MTRYRLIIDERERNVFPTLMQEMKIAEDSGKPVDYEIKTITVGDYAIIDNRTETLIASLERKTLKKDLPASLKDGRYANKEKMIEVRAKTGCRLFYIVEGPLDPAPTTKYSHFPYSTLESAMFHLEFRDGFHIMRTKDITDTIKRLIRLIYSLENVDPVDARGDVDSSYMETYNKLYNTPYGESDVENNKDVIPGENTGDNIPGDNAPVHTAQQPVNGGAMDMLTVKHEKRDIDTLREMWACFRGISIASADMFIPRYCLRDFIARKVGREEINGLKTPTGKALSRAVKTSLNNIDNAVCERMLSKVPGISSASAKEIIKSAGSLSALLSYEVGAISIIKIGKSKRNLGAKKAGAIAHFFNMKITPEAKNE